MSELRSVVTLSALYLDDLLDKLPPTTVQVVSDSILLSFETETTRALASCRDAIIGDELAMGHIDTDASTLVAANVTSLLMRCKCIGELMGPGWSPTRDGVPGTVLRQAPRKGSRKRAAADAWSAVERLSDDLVPSGPCPLRWPPSFLDFQKTFKDPACCCSRAAAAQYASRTRCRGARWLSHRAGTTPTRLTLSAVTSL